MTREVLTKQAISFLEKAFSGLDENNFIIEPTWQIDHLCYRTTSEENYIAINSHIAKFASLLIESDVNGRMISTFKLTTPIIFRNWKIDLIEVPAPKKGKIVAEGFEHFEVVCDLSFDEIKNRYRNFKFDDSGLSKELNQELEFPFNGFAVKFHHLSLEAVIKIEKLPPKI